MIIRTINLVLSIVALSILSSFVGPALYLIGSPAATILALALAIICVAWVIYAYHLITLKWYDNMVARGRRY